MPILEIDLSTCRSRCTHCGWEILLFPNLVVHTCHQCDRVFDTAKLVFTDGTVKQVQMPAMHMMA